MALLDLVQGLPRASQPLPWLITSGQPGPEDLAAAKSAGITGVIDIRDPMEPRPFDEPSTVTSLGIDYVNVPLVEGAQDEALMDELLAALRARHGQPTLLHCASANRTGGPLIAYLMIDGKVSEQDAVNTAMRSGMRSAGLMEWAVGYARKLLQPK